MRKMQHLIQSMARPESVQLSVSDFVELFRDREAAPDLARQGSSRMSVGGRPGERSWRGRKVSAARRGQATHVDADMEVSRGPDAIPGASTQRRLRERRKRPFSLVLHQIAYP